MKQSAIINLGSVDEKAAEEFALSIGQNVSDEAKAAGVIHRPIAEVWAMVRDFGHWEFNPTVIRTEPVVGEGDGCTERRVTQLPVPLAAGLEIPGQVYDEKVIKRVDDAAQKGFTYIRVVPDDSPIQTVTSFTLMPCKSNDQFTMVTQGAKFEKQQRNFQPGITLLASMGFLGMIQALRMAMKDPFVGSMTVTLSAKDAKSAGLEGGILEVEIAGFLVDANIVAGADTQVTMGFDQLTNGVATVNVYTTVPLKRLAGTESFQLEHPVNTTVSSVPVKSPMPGSKSVLVPFTATPKFECAEARMIFQMQIEGITLFKVKSLVEAANKELLGYAVKAVNQTAHDVVHGTGYLETSEWPGQPSVPHYVTQDAAPFYGLSIDQLMVVLKGHVEFFAANLVPSIMAKKAEVDPNPWTDFLSRSLTGFETGRRLLNDFMTDDEFCRQFLQGANPLEITKVTDADAQIPQEFAGKFDAADKLYFCEYSILEAAMPVKPAKNILLPDTYILFRAVDENKAPRSGLEVVGIRFKKGGAVYDKHDGKPNRYLFAKMWVMNASMQTQEFILHLGVGHFLLEGFLGPTHNAFLENKSHPVFQLLRPHFKYTLGMNSLSRLILYGQATIVADMTFSSGHKGVMALIDAYFAKMDFAKHNIADQLKSRDIGDDDLPKYFFRDDALKMWQQLLVYTQGIVDATYGDDAAVTNDAMLQSWAKMCAGTVRTFPVSIATKPQLTHLLASIIAVPVIYHTATNYGQTPYNLLPVNRPFNISSEIPDQKEDLTAEFINDALPNFATQFVGVMFMEVLTIPADNPLLKTASDPSVFAGNEKCQSAQAQFANGLEKLVLAIEARDAAETKANGSLAYPYLNPKVACTSTNI